MRQRDAKAANSNFNRRKERKMGYESRIYIVEKTSVGQFGGGMRWGRVLAHFDLGKVYVLSAKLKHAPNTDCYIYSDDGDTRFVEDRYGNPLTEVSITDAIEALETALAQGEDSREIPPLIAALKVFNDHRERFRELAVLHFGY